MPPKRTKTEVIEVVDEYKDLADFSYLKDEYVQRIHDIFNTYFHLGIKRNPAAYASKSPPSFPNDISSLSSSALGNVYGEFTAWYGFIADRFKYYTVAKNVMRAEVDKSVNAELANLVLSKGNIKTKEAVAKTSEEYITLKVYLLKIESVVEMLGNDLSSYDKSIATLSREIARREANGGF